LSVSVFRTWVPIALPGAVSIASAMLATDSKRISVLLSELNRIDALQAV
jgi:hypothetical protein